MCIRDRFLKENTDLADEIEDKIFKALGVGKYAGANDDELTDDPVDMVPNIDFDDDEDDELVAPGTPAQ